MKIPLIDSVDSIVTRLTDKNARNLKRWGEEYRSAPLREVANLTSDGRRVMRNWDLVIALSKDPRVAVSHTSGIHYEEVTVTLK